MHESTGRRRGCFKYGCCGCLGVAGLLVVLGGIIAAMALILGPPEQVLVEPEIERDLPFTPSRDLGTASSDRGDEFPVETFVPTAYPSGRVVLDLAGGEFELVAGEAGPSIHVDGRYNEGAFEFTETLEEDEDGGWVWKARFRRKVSWVRMLHGDQHEENRIRIVLPRGVPISLEGHVEQGVSRFRLGGLSLLETDLTLRMGEHSLEFDEPAPLTMERFDLKASMGEYSVSGLGNASPARVALRGQMGQMSLDLRGEWRNDSEVSAQWRMGECTVRVPEGVDVESDGAGVFLGGADLSALRRLPPAPEGAPKMKLRLNGSFGELSVRR